jgi:hypothetical protein
MFEAATSQLPSPQQMDNCLAFLQTQATIYDVDEHDIKPWTDLCHVVFNLKEMVFLR